MGYAGGIFPWTMVELSSVSPDFPYGLAVFRGNSSIFRLVDVQCDALIVVHEHATCIWPGFMVVQD